MVVVLVGVHEKSALEAKAFQLQTTDVLMSSENKNLKTFFFEFCSSSHLFLQWFCQCTHYTTVDFVWIKNFLAFTVEEYGTGWNLIHQFPLVSVESHPYQRILYLEPTSDSFGLPIIRDTTYCDRFVNLFGS